MNKRKIIISTILTFIIFLGGMAAYKILSTQPPPPPSSIVQKKELRKIAVQQFLPQTADNYITIDGRLSAYEQVNLSANVSGILLPNSKITKKGMYFKKGELLFDIDQRKAVFNLHAMRSSLMNAVTLMMPDLKIDYPDAFLNWKKYLDNFDIESPVKALPEIINEKEKYFVGVRNIHNQYYNIKSAETQLADFKIYAPFSGVIAQTNIFPGSMVMPGQALASMINTAHYELEAPITESNLEDVKIGNTVQLTATSGNKQWTGKVVRFGNTIDPATQSIPIYIKVSGRNLKEGMYLKGQIKGTPLSDVISLPKNLIVNQEFVYTLKDSTLHLQKLEIQNRDNKNVYANQFSAETWIVKDDPRGLFAGQKVAPIFIK